MSVKDIPREKLREVAKFLDRSAPLRPGEEEEDRLRYFELFLEALKSVEPPKFQYTNVQVAEFGFDDPSWKLLSDLQRRELALEEFVRCLNAIKCTGALNVFRAATPPVIKTQPATAVTVKQGEAILLSLDAECHPGPPIFQWFDGRGLPLPAQTSRSLIIRHANAAHAGPYNCRVANPFINDEGRKYVFSKWAEVTVMVPEPVESMPRQETIKGHHVPPPTVTAHPSPITTHHGGRVVMECEADNAELYEWYRNNNRVTDKPGGCQLELDPVSIEDAGEYECRAINEGGSTHSKPAKLTVETGIEVFDQPRDTTVRAGGELVLHCSARARSGQALVYNWFRTQGLKDVFEQEGRTLKCATSKEASYWTRNTPKARKYFCRIGYQQRPDINAASRKVSVTIDTVWFTEQPQEVRSVLDRRVTLKCRADGVHELSYLWLAAETKSGKMERVVALAGVKTDGNFLKIESLKQRHLRYYQCQAYDNTTGVHVESNIVQVSAGREAPVITFVKEPWSWVLNEGQRFRLVCEASSSSDTPVRYQWYHNGKSINGATQPTYIVERLTQMDYGDYYCEVATHSGLSTSPSKKAKVTARYLPEEDDEEETDSGSFTSKSGKKLEQDEAERKLLTKSQERYAREKVALLIGNQTYQSQDIDNLGSPEHDIFKLRTVLESLDFKVISLIDLTFEEMRRALDQFYEMLTVSGVYALFYYSGHGFSYLNNAFLMPVDATLPLNTAHNIQADEVSGKMQRRLSRALLVLDCCQVERPDTVARDHSLAASKNFTNRVIITSCFNQQRAYDGDLEPLGVVESKPGKQQLRPTSSCSDFNIAFTNAIAQRGTVNEVYNSVIKALKSARVRGQGDTDQRPDITGSFYDNDITLHDPVMLDDPHIEDKVEKMIQLFKLASYIPEPVFIEGAELGELEGVARLELRFSEHCSNVLLLSLFLHLLQDKATMTSLDCHEPTLVSQGLTLTVVHSGEEEEEGRERFSVVQQTVHKISGLQKLKDLLQLKVLLTVQVGGGEERQTEVDYQLPRNPLFSGLLLRHTAALTH